ncbi:amino acid adenylation domain-containing protein [Thalassospira australica]|uniref:amino acid adenylation domain-containing protein n=1 Tax=Thalassospira australica TaxID=1528106 RepID=UPI00138DFF3A|nr:amino acid adenylation domain-containing protein [Thalassospira australica]
MKNIGLHQPFFATAALHPNRTALSINGRDYCYAELASAAFGFASFLQSRNIEQGARIGLHLEKGLYLYAAILGTLLTGNSYIPLAPSYPTERLNLIVEQAQLSLIFFDAEESLAPAFPATTSEVFCDVGTLPLAEEHDVSPVCIDHDQCAYILFTSGSTGKPKGVMVSHSNATAFVNWATAYCNANMNDRFSGHSDLNFDLSIFDTFVPWKVGAALYPVIEMMDKATPGRFIQVNKITVWFSVPSILSSMSAMSDIQPEKLHTLRWMLFCGEPLLPRPVQALMSVASHIRVANLYGPTEATVACSSHEVSKIPDVSQGSIAIGWQTAGTGIFVWNEIERRVAGLGESGEIYIYGDQVSLGYWNNEAETRARYVPDPRTDNPAYRCYKTGDCAIVGKQGPIFKSRLDNQVKFRGWRVELGDVEHALARHVSIVECAVSIIQREGKPDAMVAFVRVSEKISIKVLIHSLKKMLPNYMIPTHVRTIENFPRTVNGKIDRKILPSLFL